MLSAHRLSSHGCPEGGQGRHRTSCRVGLALPGLLENAGRVRGSIPAEPRTLQASCVSLNPIFLSDREVRFAGLRRLRGAAGRFLVSGTIVSRMPD